MSNDDAHTVEDETFTFVADTCNATSWTGAKRYLRRTEADLVFLQEHHLAPSRVAAASAWALGRGWHSLFLPAVEGTGEGWRGGVAILARPHVGLSVPSVGPVEIEPARIMAASIEPPGFRRTTAICAYLDDGKGVGAANLRHLGAIGRCIGMQGEHVPCIVGGDWQAAPESVAATGFATQSGMALVATGHPRGTYRAARSATELDYFFLSSDLALGLDSIETVEGAGVKPQVPARVTFLPRLASTRALHVRCPPPLPTARMVGPLRQVSDWQSLRDRARRLAARAANPSDVCGDDFSEEYAQVYSEWADQAELEIIEATGAAFYGDPKRRGLRGKAPALRWRSIVSERPPRRGTDAAHVAWREMAAKTVETQRALHYLMAATLELADGDADDFVDDVGSEEVARGERGAGLAAHVASAEAILGAVRKELEEWACGDELGIQATILRDLTTASLLVAEGADGAVASAHAHELARAADQVECLLDRLAAIRTVVDREVANAAKKEKADEIAAWKDWVAENINAGAKNRTGTCRSQRSGSPPS